MSETRKLAAILVADVVGYSRLAGADEDRILARLRTLRSDLIDPIIAVHHGRIVKRTGDGSIIEFRSVVDAVRCAIEVMSGLIERNAGVPPERRIEFRVGIHSGDIVEESDGDLMGDGVNIAARLEGIAKPGAICLSEDAYRQVKGRLEMTVSDLGATQLKNIAEPIRVYSLEVGQPAQAKPAPVTPAAISAVRAESAPPSPKPRVFLRWPALAAALAVAVVAVGVYAWHAGFAPRLLGASVAEDKLATAPRLSLVVLPFENLSGDPDQQYFADGLTDDLTTDLSHLPRQFRHLAQHRLHLQGQAGRSEGNRHELGVRYVLEGSVRRVGEAIAVNAQLISTETGAHVWADRFDGERSKLGQLQVEFVSRLANSLGVELVKAEACARCASGRNNPDAVDLSMRGWAEAFRAWSKASEDAAIGLFERALAHRPPTCPGDGRPCAHFDRSDGISSIATIGKATSRGRRIGPSAPLSRSLTILPRIWRKPLCWVTANGNGRKRSRRLTPRSPTIQITPKPMPHAVSGSCISVEARMASRGSKPRFVSVLAIRTSPIGSSRFASSTIFWRNGNRRSNGARRRARARLTFSTRGSMLAAANAGAGHDKEAKEAVAQLQKLYPGYTVQTYGGTHFSDDPTFNAQRARIYEGLRKAGLPEGEKKTD